MSQISRRVAKIERALVPTTYPAVIGQFIERGAEEIRYSQLLERAAAGVLTDDEDIELDTIMFFALGRMRTAGFHLATPAVVGSDEQRRAAVMAAAVLSCRTHEEELDELE
ncbi:MAG: hypothetical protein WCJ64_04535 [Rhodospirillaceae bacterium]